ncbi:ATP-binding protein [Candidatus Hodarchaeum mangrovi]
MELPEKGPYDRDLLDKLPVGVIVLKDLLPVFYNKKYKNDLNLSEDRQVSIQEFLSFLDPSEHDRLLQIIEKKDYNLPPITEWRAKTINGDSTWIQIRVGRLDLKHHIVVVRNIGKLKKFAQQVSLTESQYQYLIEKAPNFIFIVKNGVIDYYNTAFVERLGYTRQEIDAKKAMPTFFVAPEDRKKIGQFLIEGKRELIKGNVEADNYIELPEQKAEFDLVAKDGTRIPVHALVRKVYLGKDYIIQGVLVDLSSIKELQEMKFDFLTLSQHHLRTPLANMKAYLDFYKKRIEKDISEEEKETLELKFLDVLSRNINRMVSLTDDLNDIALIRQGRLKCNLRGENFIPTLQRALEGIEFLLQQYRVHLIVEYPQIPLIVNFDRNRIIQALRNVLDNAIRFTGHGTINISLTTDLNNQLMLLKIKDSGVGITTSQLPEIGKPFVTFHSSQSGLGLGLFLTKQIISDHGGTLTVFSEGFNRGTTVTITLPLLVHPDANNHLNEDETDLSFLIRQATSAENMIIRMEAIQELWKIADTNNLESVLNTLEQVILYDRDRTLRNLASKFYSELIKSNEVNNQ